VSGLVSPAALPQAGAGAGRDGAVRWSWIPRCWTAGWWPRGTFVRAGGSIALWTARLGWTVFSSYD